MMAELSPPGFDNMVRSFLQIQIYRTTYRPCPRPRFVPNQKIKIKIAVLRLIRALEPRIVDDWPKRDSSYYQQVGQQLGRLPLLVRPLHLRKFGHLVRRGHPKG